MKEPTPQSARLTEQLLEYWQSLKGARAYPFEEEVNPEELSAIWPSCFLVQVLGEGRFSYSYMGDALVAAYGDDLVGHEITESLLYPHPLSLFKKFSEVVENVQSATDENEFKNSSGVLIKYRSAVVPLGMRAHPEQVRYVLGGMKWKMY